MLLGDKGNVIYLYFLLLAQFMAGTKSIVNSLNSKFLTQVLKHQEIFNE